ncbi:MAG: DUF3084 domain-containing protein [Halanaerobiaceae bacterium]|nr:DUF3084 domain-containing protein [Halanaerobiaceae bacterium]
MYGVLLIVVVIGLSGLIAYLGDRIGMRVGKRRISLFGLRPKYTSIIITVLTGVIIASLTITIILATNNGVRQALFNIQQVLVRLEDSRNQLDYMNHQMYLKDIELKEKEEEIKVIELELSRLQEQKEQLEKENQILDEQINELEGKLSTIVLEYEAAQQDIDYLTETIKNLDATREGMERQLARLQSERKSLEEQIQVLNMEIARVNQELSDTTIRYYLQDLVYQKGDIIYLDVIEKGESQEEIIDSIAAYLDRANQEVLKQPVEVAPETGTALRLNIGEIAALTRIILESESERFIVYLVANVNVSQNSYVPARFQINEDFIVFKQGDLIASKIIRAGASVIELERALNELLDLININSIRKGIITNQGSIGSIEFSSFYQILRRVQDMSGNVEVKVIATEDIWREDGWNNQFSNKILFDVVPAVNGDLDA